MPTINNNLFPPVVKDSQRSFVRTQNCRIYFSLSQYNNIDDIKNVQISLVNQKTNASALNPTKYPSAIKIVNKGTNNFHYDATIKDDYKYYIEIEPNAVLAQSDLATNYFELNQYYLVQMRFTSSNPNVPDPPVDNGLDTWLFNNRDYFSEWSTICLIKGIDNPEILITGLEETGIITLTSPLSNISGKVVYSSLEKFSTSWVRKTAESGDIISNSTTRICSTDYIDVTSYLYMFFEVNNGYKYIIQCYNAEKEWLGTNYTIDWTTEKRKLFIDENIYYILITLAKTNNTGINIGAGSNLTIRSSSASANKSQTEYLKSYYITVYETSKGINNPTFKSQEIYTNQYKPNEFNYEIPYDFDRGINYTLAFTYTTNNLYTATTLYKFIIDAKEVRELDVVLTITPDNSHGRVQIDLDFENTVKTGYDLLIRRSSFKDDFRIYHTIAKIPHAEKKSLRYTWYDTSIESGTYYKYRIQEDTEGGKYVNSDDFILCAFEDIFLTSGDKQLKVQFNPSVTDLKYNLMESQQTTLGSQFPFVRRNGNNFFRSFSVSGLISSQMDENSWYDPMYDSTIGKFHSPYELDPFTSKKEIYQTAEKTYNTFNEDNAITEYDDYIYEREFRNKVMEYLYRNDIKLFRSLTEGNILVKLMNISFQPIDSLGRRLYSFSASAIEMDDCKIPNYEKYNILNKTYFNYKTKKFTFSNVKGYQSLVDRIKATEPNIEKIYKIIDLGTNKNNTIIQLKEEKNDQPIRYITRLQNITNRAQEYGIEDFWHCGLHLNPNQYTETGEYYAKVADVENPKANGVYEIADLNEAFKIDDYITYNRRARILDTFEEEVEELDANTWALYVKQFYNRYIYYGGQWYPFGQNGDILMPMTTVTVTIYYKERSVIE